MTSLEATRLSVHSDALDAVVSLDGVAKLLPPYRPDLRAQLWRASSSIALNIAEGADEYSPAEKARFYRMARRSAAECAAILDISERIDPRLDTRKPRVLLARIMPKLTALVKSVERRSR